MLELDFLFFGVFLTDRFGGLIASVVEYVKLFLFFTQYWQYRIADIFPIADILLVCIVCIGARTENPYWADPINANKAAKLVSGMQVPTHQAS